MSPGVTSPTLILNHAGPRVHTAEMATGTEVKIQTERGSMPAYCAVPTPPPSWPGVVVVHDFPE
jgi:hypothetical protein